MKIKEHTEYNKETLKLSWKQQSMYVYRPEAAFGKNYFIDGLTNQWEW